MTDDFTVVHGARDGGGSKKNGRPKSVEKRVGKRRKAS